LHGAHLVRRARRVRAAGPPDGARAEPGPRGATGGGRLMLALLAALQLQAVGASMLTSPAAAPDASLPTVPLAEALRRAAGLDPDYVQAIGQVDNAVWARRSAFAVFILPSVALNTQANQYAPAFFNFATLKPEKYAVQAQVSLQYDLFTGGQKVAELS